MCGIAGILLFPGASGSARLSAIERMTGSLRHRGPDGEGFWSDQSAGIALGHRRLAIVDLTAAGRQPMLSRSGRFVITYNGEIYNFPALRRDLQALGHSFQGGSDTEVLLAGFEQWGIEATLRRTSGMFAFGLWDRGTRALHLVRDRMGKKPLYVARTLNGIVFASELKAIGAVPDFRPEVDPKAVAALVAYGWVPHEHCIWRNVFKLPPAGILSLGAEALAASPDAEALRAKARTWWSLSEVAENGRSDLCTAGDGEMAAELDRLLRQAVRERMVADVPIGAFLSGGIDSSTVVALMQAQSSRPVRTFTIAFGEAAYDESVNAAGVARHLGTDHTELRLTPADAREVIPEMPRVWDEPFADESQIPTLLVSRLARRHVTVALSGDGGDECFAGYARHFVAARLDPLFGSRLVLRRLAAAAMALLARGSRQNLVAALPLPNGVRRALQGDRLGRLAHLVAATSAREMYERMTRLSELPLTLSPEGAGPDATPPFDDLVSSLIFRDMAGYLPDDILVKLDRASMATSLEARCPLLDHRVIEFAWRLPTTAKVRHGQGKWILREVLARYVPPRLFERPKQGFDVPVGGWLRGPLKAWAADLLAEPRLRSQGLLDAQAVQACWQEHASGRRDRSRVLWAILMLQAWLDAHGAPAARPATEILEPALEGG